MKTFDRYLLSQMLTLFGFFSLVLVAVYWVNRAVSLFDSLIAGGQNVAIFFEFTALALPNVIVNVLPVSALVATIYGINRMSGDSELVVAQTSGVGPFALARPVLVFGAIVLVLVSLLSHVLVPASRAALGDRGAEISRDITGRFLKEGEFLHPGTGVTVYVREITENGELRGIFLQDRRSPNTNTTYAAERAILLQTNGIPSLVMFEGMAQTLQQDTQNLTVVTFEDFTYDLATLAGSSARAPGLRELPTPAVLRASPEDQNRTGADLAAFRYEAHARFGEPLFAATLPMLALGIMMLGRYSRMGLWRQIVGAVFLAILVQMLGNLAKTEVLKDAARWPLIYVPPLISLCIGLGALGLAAAGPLRRRAAEPSTGGLAP